MLVFYTLKFVVLCSFSKFIAAQATLKTQHESGVLSPEDIIESHSEGIQKIEKDVSVLACLQFHSSQR